MNKQRIAAWVLFFLVCVTGLSSCSRGYSGPFVSIPPAALNPPLYPSAQQTQATPTTFNSFDANWQNRRDVTVKSVTFFTPDEVERVFAFYKEVLIKEGWEPRTPNLQPQASDVIFDWKKAGCPEYYFEVAVSRNPDNTLTRVQLTPMQIQCIG